MGLGRHVVRQEASMDIALGGCEDPSMRWMWQIVLGSAMAVALGACSSAGPSGHRDGGAGAGGFAGSYGRGGAGQSGGGTSGGNGGAGGGAAAHGGAGGSGDAGGNPGAGGVAGKAGSGAAGVGGVAGRSGSGGAGGSGGGAGQGAGGAGASSGGAGAGGAASGGVGGSGPGGAGGESVHLVTFAFTGHVESLRNAVDPTNDTTPRVGDPFTGSYTYDSNAGSSSSSFVEVPPKIAADLRVHDEAAG